MKKYLTEFIGTFFLVAAVGLSVIGGAGNLAPIAIGATLMVMIFAGGHVSGAHYNPAVSFGAFLRGKLSAADLLPYIISQLLGATVAAFFVRWILGDAVPAEAAPVADVAKAFAAEVVGTFALVYVVLNVATAKGTNGNSFYGLAIGFTVTAMAYALGGISGGAFNPAVGLGISIFSLAAWQSLWIYIVACLAGGALAAFVFKYLNPDDK